MNYFRVEQDKRYLHPPGIDQFIDSYNRVDFSIERSGKVPDRNVVFSNSDYELDDIDFLESPVILVSETVKDVFSMYERTLKFKTFCILNNLRRSHYTYYAPIFKKLDLHVGESLTDEAVFKIPYRSKEVVIIRLDVAESLLRRSVRGIKLTTVINWREYNSGK